MNIQELHSKLNENGYICTERFASKVFLALNTRPVGGAFLFGPPGSGKSFLPQVLSQIYNYPIVYYQCFPGTREDDLIVKLVPDPKEKSGIKASDGPLTQAVKLTHSAKENQKVILVLDEFDKTRPSADAFLLDFLQSGRVWLGDVKTQAVLDKLIVFITSNEEREISEPLRRRLPRIDVKLPSPQLVRDALKLTHGEHPYLDSVSLLYTRSMVLVNEGKLSKPITIQELRQFLDAIDLMMKVAPGKVDWNDMVYQYLTKSPDDHAALKESESYNISIYIQEEDIPRLNADAYSVSEQDSEEGNIESADEAEVYEMPSPSLWKREKIESLTVEPISENKENITQNENLTIILNYTDDNYSNIIKAFNPEGTENASVLDSNFRVVRINNQDYIVGSPVIYLDDKLKLLIEQLYTNRRSSLDITGEILVKAPWINIEMLKSDEEFRSCFDIIYYKKDEMCFKGNYNTCIGYCSNKDGLELILNLDRISSYSDFWNSSFGRVFYNNKKRLREVWKNNPPPKITDTTTANEEKYYRFRSYTGSIKRTLGKNLYAYVEVDLDIADNVNTTKPHKATCNIYLPVVRKHSYYYIDPRISFVHIKIPHDEKGYEVSLRDYDCLICDSSNPYKGTYSKDNTLYKKFSKIFSEEKQSIACNEAWKWGLSLVSDIQKAIRRRKYQILNSADVNQDIAYNYVKKQIL